MAALCYFASTEYEKYALDIYSRNAVCSVRVGRVHLQSVCYTCRKELQQDATKGFERFQMDSIFSLGGQKVSLASLMPCAPPTPAAPTAAPSAAAAAAATAGGAYTDGEIQQLLGQLNWESELSVDDIQVAREEAQEAYESLCRCATLCTAVP